MPKFKSGDIVQLKSGGPKMTVSREDLDGQGCFCTWFAGSKMQNGHFNLEQLEKFEEPPKKK